MRDYITHDIQEAQSLLENLSTQEEAIKEEGGKGIDSNKEMQKMQLHKQEMQ